jgi:hypothetical protein
MARSIGTVKTHPVSIPLDVRFLQGCASKSAAEERVRG